MLGKLPLELIARRQSHDSEIRKFEKKIMIYDL